MQPGQKLEEIIALLRDLPALNRSTMIYLARFFKRVSEFSDQNKMNQYNLAVIVSPNLFRSKELSNIDLINQGNFPDVFTVLMNNTEYILSRIQQDDSNFAQFENMMSQDNGAQSQPKNINRTSGWHEIGGLRRNPNSIG